MRARGAPEALMELKFWVRWARLLLIFQRWLWLVDGLPAVAAVAGPTAVIPVVAVNRPVLTSKNVVPSNCHPGIGIGVVGKSAASSRALAGVNVAHVAGPAPGH